MFGNISKGSVAQSITLGLALTGLLCAASAAMAQHRPAGLPNGFPNKTVRVIVGSAAGGGADFLARTLVAKISEAWGASFIVENIPSGIGGLLALEVSRKAAPDGYTIQNSSGSTFQNATFAAKVDSMSAKRSCRLPRLPSRPCTWPFFRARHSRRSRK